MELYLIRHGEAQPRDPAASDEQRTLTRKGVKQLVRSVKGLERIGVRFEHMLHSPLLRAVETAELLMPLLAGESSVSGELARAPSVEFIEALEGETVALVGHEPWLSDLVLWLILGWRVYDGQDRLAPFDFEKGMVVWLSGEPRPGAMRLRAMYPPRTLRRLAR